MLLGFEIQDLGVLGLPDLRRARDSLTALRDPNRSGDSYGFLAITPIKPGRTGAVRQTIASVTAKGSPFRNLPRTHFARWVILPDFYDPTVDYQPADEDRLGCEYLIFSACFDGPRDTYLRELAARIPAEAEAVWGECVGVDASSSEDLVRYLRHNQIDCGQYYAAYNHSTVEEVRRVLVQQRAMRDLAVRAHELTPAALQAEFIARIASPGAAKETAA